MGWTEAKATTIEVPAAQVRAADCLAATAKSFLDTRSARATDDLRTAIADYEAFTDA